jgi:predicted nucleic acid-binding protein
MYLVDTSVWIDYINGLEVEHVAFLDKLLLNNPLTVGLNNLIYMEILQGSKNQKVFDQFRRYFSVQKFYRLQHQEKSHAAAAQIVARFITKIILFGFLIMLCQLNLKKEIIQNIFIIS